MEKCFLPNYYLRRRIGSSQRISVNSRTEFTGRTDASAVPTDGQYGGCITKTVGECCVRVLQVMTTDQRGRGRTNQSSRTSLILIIKFDRSKIVHERWDKWADVLAWLNSRLFLRFRSERKNPKRIKTADAQTHSNEDRFPVTFDFDQGWIQSRSIFSLRRVDMRASTMTIDLRTNICIAMERCRSSLENFPW